MSDNSTHPWPVWATVTIVCALISAWAVTKNAELTARTPILIASQPATQQQTTSTAYVPAAAMGTVAAAPVEFTIHDTIGVSQLDETVRILMDGAFVGTLHITREQPSATLRATVPAAGRHFWSASASGTFVYPDGESLSHSGSGQGIVDIENGTSFDLRSTYNGPMWSIDIERDDTAAPPR